MQKGGHEQYAIFMKVLVKKAPPEKINGQRIYLKKYELRLAPLMFAYVDKDRKRLRKFLPWVDAMKAVSVEANFIKMSTKKWKLYELFGYGIFRKSDDMYMGNIGVHSIKWEHRACELGYWILGDYEGQGYMSEAVRTLEGTMFKLGFNRVQIRCNSVNARSANVPRACGYKQEGTIREDAIELGKFRNTMVFGKLKREWKARK